MVLHCLWPGRPGRSAVVAEEEREDEKMKKKKFVGISLLARDEGSGDEGLDLLLH